MAENEYVNEVIYGGQTLISLTNDTVTPQTLARGVTAHDRSGAQITGTADGANLQTKTITAGTSDQTVNPDSGYDGFSSVTVSPTPSETKTEGPNVSTNKDVTPTSGKLLSKVTITPLSHTEYSPSSSTYTQLSMGEQKSIDLGANHSTRYVRVEAEAPSGTKSITSNGTVDVTAYASASVNVPTPTLDGNAIEDHVLSGKTFYSNSTTKKTGSMTNNGAVSPTALAAGGSYTVPEGYHNGAGTVTAQSLASQTGVDSGKTAIDASHVVSGYQGWVNGSKVSGTYVLPSGTKDNTSSPLTTNGDHTITGLSSYTGVKVNVNVPEPTLSGDATAENVLSGKTFYNTSTTKQTGSMTNKGAWTSTGNKANASTTKNVTIPAGYHNGSGYVQLASLSSQTGVDSGKTAIDASHVVSGYQGWVNGSKISGSYNLPSGTKDDTGTPITTNGDHTITGLSSYEGVKVNVNVPAPALDGDAGVNDVLYGKTFYSNNSTKKTGAIQSKEAYTYNVSTSDQTIDAGKYIAGTQTIRGVTTENLIAENIKNGVTIKVGDSANAGRIKNVTGTYAATFDETLLWENSSPSTAISYTTITLSEGIRNSNGIVFQYLKVVSLHNPSNYMQENVAIIPVSVFTKCVEGGSSSNLIPAFHITNCENNWRSVYYVSATQIKFSRYDGKTSGSSTRVMPYKIYGIRRTQ